jgi:hypothetical protein
MILWLMNMGFAAAKPGTVTAPPPATATYTISVPGAVVVTITVPSTAVVAKAA